MKRKRKDPVVAFDINTIVPLDKRFEYKRVLPSNVKKYERRGWVVVEPGK